MQSDKWFEFNFWEQVVGGFVTWSVHTGPRVIVLAVVLLVGLKLIRVGMGKLETRLIERNLDSPPQSTEQVKRIQTLMGIVQTLAIVSLWVVFIMLILTEVGVDVGPLIAGAGVVGVAIGFGAQELVRDLISGFFILLENHIREGDVAVINGQGGLVENIGLRTIRLRDLSGTVHVFQNGKVDTLSNMTKEWSAMVFDVGVAYKEDTDRVCQVMHEVSEELRHDQVFGPKILEPIEVFGVENFGDSAVVLRARLKTRPIEQWNVGREFRRRLKYAFDAKGIEIPFPHRTLYWGSQLPSVRIETASEARSASS